MYDDQDMVCEPEPCLANVTPWRLLWTYHIKAAHENFCKKARCVCDGSSHGRQYVMLGHNFANSLQQDGERVFWAFAAQKGMICVGADVSNAFAKNHGWVHLLHST
jgi:hypothetical protein